MPDPSKQSPTRKTAVVYRMVMPTHVCPYGIKALHLLKRAGYEVDDRHLTTREQTDAFKAEHGVATTPQIFIGDVRVGGHDDLRRFLGKRVADPKATSYRPVIALFSVTALMALAASYAVTGSVMTPLAAEWFIGFSMVVLALLKLQNLESFATMFLNYDLLARRWVPYGCTRQGRRFRGASGPLRSQGRQRPAPSIPPWRSSSGFRSAIRTRAARCSIHRRRRISARAYRYRPP